MPGHIPAIPEGDLKRILAWINEFIPATTAEAFAAEISRLQSGSSERFTLGEAPAAAVRRQDFNETTAIRLVTELWRETLQGTGISETSDEAKGIFIYIHESLNESGRVSGGAMSLLPVDEQTTRPLEVKAFGILSQREIDIDSFASSGAARHKLPLKGMMIGALLKAAVDAGRVSKEVVAKVINPMALVPAAIAGEAQALSINVRRNFREWMDAARLNGDSNLRQAFTNVLEDESPGQVAAGESIFETRPPSEASGDDIDKFLKDQDSFVDDEINRRNPEFNPSTTVDKEQANILSKAHIREKALFKQQFDDLVDSGVEPADAAQELIGDLRELTEQDFFQTIQGVQQETAEIEERERLEKLATPEGMKKAVSDLAFEEGLDISPNAVDPRALAELQRRFPVGGITPEYREAFRNIVPVLQQQKSNADFAAQKPEERQAQIGGQLGFGQTTFGTQRGGFTFRTPFEIAQQRALGAAQANAAAVIDTQLQQAFTDDPSLMPSEFLSGLQTPGRSFGEVQREIGTLQTQDRGGFVSAEGIPAQGFAQDIPGRILQIRAEQPTIAGLLPFQVPGSLSERQQFGLNPPTPPLAPGQPTIGGRASGPRGRTLPDELIFDRENLRQIVADFAGEDPDLRRFLLRRVSSSQFANRFRASSIEGFRQAREADRFRVSRTFESDRDASGELTGRAGRFVTTRTRRRSTPGTTSQIRLTLSGFARGQLGGLREKFVRPKRFRSGGQATFRPFGSGRF